MQMGQSIASDYESVKYAVKTKMSCYSSAQPSKLKEHSLPSYAF